MQWIKSKTFWAGLALLLAVSTAASYAHRQWQINKAHKMSEELFKPEKPNPICFGRLMIDLPRHATVTGMLTKHPGAQNIQLTEGVTKEAFEQTVSEFEKQLRETRHRTDPSLLKSAMPIPDTPGARLFVHWEEDYSKHTMMLTSYRWLPNNTQYKFVSEVSLEYVPSATEDMLSALKGLRSRAINEVPTEHGFCIEGGFFPDTQTGEWLERFELAIDFEPWADMNVSILGRTNHTKIEDTLLDRVRAMPGKFPVLAHAMNVMRSGGRDLGPHKGEEALVELNEDGRRIYTFVWETQGEIDRNDLPTITVEMRIGHDKVNNHPMPTKDQMLAAWEYILRHLRVRPASAPVKTSQAVPPKRPLGERTVTGYACPQTGWWQCAHDGEVQGGHRQFFQAGEPMPHAVVLYPPTLWQRLKGEQPMYPTTAVWTLVDYEQGPSVAADAASDTPPASRQDQPPAGPPTEA